MKSLHWLGQKESFEESAESAPFSFPQAKQTCADGLCRRPALPSLRPHRRRGLLLPPAGDRARQEDKAAALGHGGTGTVQVGPRALGAPPLPPPGTAPPPPSAWGPLPKHWLHRPESGVDLALPSRKCKHSILASPLPLLFQGRLPPPQFLTSFFGSHFLRPLSVFPFPPEPRLPSPAPLTQRSGPAGILIPNSSVPLLPSPHSASISSYSGLSPTITFLKFSFRINYDLLIDKSSVLGICLRDLFSICL